MNDPARVCILTTSHSATDARVVRKEAVSLARAGYEVHLVAPDPGSWEIEHVSLVPIPVPRRRLERFTSTPLQALLAGIGVRADVYHFHDPELWPVGMLLRSLGKTVVYDVHENTPAIMFQRRWIPSSHRRWLSAVVRITERIVVRAMTGIVAADDMIADRFAGLNHNIVVVRNYPLLDEFEDPDHSEKMSTGDSSDCIVCFSGVSEARVTHTVVEAVGLVNTVHGSGELHLVLGGKIESEEYLRHCQAISGWDWVQFLGHVDRLRMGSILRKALASIVLFSPAPNHFDVRSNRLYESMAAALPVIVPSFPSWERIVREYQCGIAVDPTDSAAVANAIETLRNDRGLANEMGSNGRQAILSKFNWRIENDALLRFYSALTSDKTKLVGGSTP